MKTLALVISFAMLSSSLPSAAAGVTVITHGWIQTFEGTLAGRPAWLDNMAQAVTNAANTKGLKSSWYHLKISGLFSGQTATTLSRISGLSASDSEEVVVTVDWIDIA